MGRATQANIEEIARMFRKQFSEGSFNRWLEGESMSDVLGPRVTGGSYPGLAAKPKKPKPNPRSVPLDRVEIDYNGTTRLVHGFKIFLGRENKMIFMPIAEVMKGLNEGEKFLLQRDTKKFMLKYRGAMVITARKRLREEKIGTKEELNEYQAESWMTPDQIAVLKELRAECA